LSKRGKRRGASQHKDDEIAEKVFLLILARAKLSKERDVMMMMREILIGDFLFLTRETFSRNAFFFVYNEALLLFLSESTHRRHRRERLLVELFLGREGGALSLLLTCSLI
jgi:hypothetical protein